MNTTAFETPLDDSDRNALLTALNAAPNSGGAKIASLKMIYQVACNAKTFGISESDIFKALSEGFDDEGPSALCEALHWETKIIGSWGTLIIQAAGWIQLFNWITGAFNWLINKITSVEQLILGMVGKQLGSAIGGLGGAVLSPLSGIANMLTGSASGSATGAKQDRRYKHDSSALVSGLMIMATSEAPAMMAMMNMLNTSPSASTNQPAQGGQGAGTGGGTGTGTGTGNTGTANTGTGNTGAGTTGTGNTGTGNTGATGTATTGTPTSAGTGATGTGTGTTPSDRRSGRRMRDSRAMGINTRRNLVSRNNR